MNQRSQIGGGITLAFLLAGLLNIQTVYAASDPQFSNAPAIIPQPVTLERLSGKPFPLDEGVSVSLGADTPSECARSVIRCVRVATGVELALSRDGIESKAKTIRLRLDPSVGQGRPKWQAAESYVLTVSSDGGGIEIAASDAHGLFNGAQTLTQLAEKDADGRWRIPAVRIEDYPRFQWRGYLLDTARHFRPKAEVLRYIDLMALHKLNVLHLHLTDDQGWRIEIRRYPKLTEVGAALPNYSKGLGTGWFYTQADIREIVAYAAERHIVVMPEIEMPGHSMSTTTSYPELSCDGAPSTELCAGKESTFEFMTNVLSEVADLFPSRFIHVGADEVQPERWRACPACSKRMEELAAAGPPAGVQPFRVQVTTTAGRPFHEDIGRLQGDFIRRIDRFLAGKGKRMTGWDEILDSGLESGSSAAVVAWRSPTAISGAVGQGRDVIVSLYPEYYLDNKVPLARTYAVEPVSPDFSEAQARHVLGVQGNMWAERTPTQAAVDQRTFPRLCALAEVGWSPRESRNFPDFVARLDRHAERLRLWGISLFRNVVEWLAPP